MYKRQGFSYLLGGALNLGLQGVWYGMAADWACRSVFFLLRYRSKAWRRRFTLRA